jgi:hypothetical protein
VLFCVLIYIRKFMRFDSIKIFLFLLFPLVIVLSYLGLPWFAWSDGVEHAAAVKELSNNFFHPQNPLLSLDGSTSPRFVPSIMLMALFMKITHAEIYTVIRIFTVLFFFFFSFSVWHFSCNYFKDRDQGIYSLLALLFLWGKGWDGANAYMFSVLIWNAYYPSVVSFSLSLLGCSFLLKYLRNNLKIYVFAYLVITCLVCLNHPLTGTFYFLSTFLLILAEKQFTLKTSFIFLFSIIISVLVVLLWPYYSHLEIALNIIGGSMNNSWDYNFTWNYLYSEQFARSGPALLGIPVLIYYLRKKQHLFMVYGFFACVVIYGLSYFFKLHLGERYIFFIVFFLQIIFSRYLKEKGISSYKSIKTLIKPFTWKRFITFIVMLGTLGGVAGQAYLVRNQYLFYFVSFSPQLQLYRYVNPLSEYKFLKRYLSKGDVVFSDITTSWVIPVITEAKVVSLFHNNPLVSDSYQRIKDTEIFFGPKTSTHLRKALFMKYNASHLLINRKIESADILRAQGLYVPFFDASLLKDMISLGSKLYQDNKYILIELQR